MESKRSTALSLPGAIIVAGAIIAIAIIWTQKPIVTNIGGTTSANGAAAAAQPNMAPISTADHILGNPNAPIKLVEYSDLSCPFCKMFNPVMEQIMTEYGPSGNVAWVYRQFPLDQPDSTGNVLHPNAGTQAQALECVAALGGNTAFWAFEKEWFNTFPQDGASEDAPTDNQFIAQVGKDVGLDPAAFSDCIDSGRFKDRVNAEYTDGLNVGVSGTPYLVIVAPDGSKIPLAGSQSYDTLKSAIDTLVSSIPAASGAGSSAASSNTNSNSASDTGSN